MTEIMSRELIGNLITAALLAARGHVAVILNQEDAFILSRRSVSGTTIFHAKSLHYSKERIRQHEKLHKDGFIITSMDQEHVLLNPAVPAYLSGRFCPENLEIAERVYTWNQLEAEELWKQFPDFAGKILAYGSPRVDAWGPRFRHLRRSPSATRRQLLLTPSVSMNDSLRHWDHMAIAKSVSRSGAYGNRDLDSFFKSQFEELRSQVFFSKLALKLADAFPANDVILAPKKNEIRDSWVKSLWAFDTAGDGSRPNLHIEYSRILEESVHGADVVINSTSTAGLTALIGGVPLISFGPTESMASQLGAQVSDVEQAFDRVSEALAEPQGFVNTYESENFKMLGNRIMFSDSRLAAESIVEDLETFDSGKRSGITFLDLLLHLGPGAIRRFLSALKAGIKLRRSVSAHPQKVEKISQGRVNEIFASILRGIGGDLKMRAVVVGGRNIFVIPGSKSDF